MCRAQGLPLPELLSFRLNPGLGRTDSESKSNVLGGPSAKFGVPPEAIVGAYAAAAAAGCQRFGMHMMTGSCVMSEDYWAETVAALVAACKAVLQGTPVRAFEFINIGGGLGIPYQPGAPAVDTSAVAARIRATLEQQWAAAGLPLPLPALAMENGRYMTGPFGWLVARCQSQKKAWGSVYHGLDACMANLMRPGACAGSIALLALTHTTHTLHTRAHHTHAHTSELWWLLGWLWALVENWRSQLTAHYSPSLSLSLSVSLSSQACMAPTTTSAFLLMLGPQKWRLPTWWALCVRTMTGLPR